MPYETIADAAAADRLFAALADQLALRNARYELVVVGGAALLARGLVKRATRDVDVVALRKGEKPLQRGSLPADLIESRDRVARDFRVPNDWLNDEPAALLDFGLPTGFVERLTRRDYGGALVVWFASRLDQIHLKLYAMVDQGPGKHEQDLRALDPTPAELTSAARWSRTHDPSDGYLTMLREALSYLALEDADLDA